MYVSPSIHTTIKTYSIVLHVVKFYKWYLLWIEDFCPFHLPPQIYAEALTHNMMAVEGGAFGKVFMFR